MTQPDGIADAAGLVAFHMRHKLLLMAHSPANLTALGRIVATAGSRRIDEVRTEYAQHFHSTLACPATRGGHVNALQHMIGYFRGLVTDTERRALSDAIDSFAHGGAPLAHPLSLIREHAAAHRVRYLLEQRYLADTPAMEREP